jgi:Zn-dependent protease/CBS domain-containing protein
MPMRASRRGSFQLASFRGIPIRIHFSLLLVLPLMAFLFGGAFSRAALEAGGPPGGMRGAPVLWGLAVAVGLFTAVLVHELAHVLYALRTGGTVRSVTLMMVGGVSELTEAPKRPRDEALMALVGPLTSLGLAGLLYGALLLVRGLGPNALGYSNLQFALFYLALLNLILGLFNLLPAFPLDGGRVMRAMLVARLGPVRGTRMAAGLGKLFAALFGVVGVMSLNPFLLLIAFFVYMGADGEARQVAMKVALEGLPVVQVMSPRTLGLDAEAPLPECLGALRRERRLALPLLEDGRPVGWVTLEAVQAVPPRERPLRTAREVQEPVETLPLDSDAWSAVQRMSERGVPRLAVVDGEGRMVGMVDGHDLTQALLLHQRAEEARQREERGRGPRWPRERPA